ncbi:macrophage mannose receptor 1-like isoform X2 [Ruditapes philippinarum]|uniref:macrophage mannose receptor 1-like isoform X2 n=1 Tax=Ruditapes philippinarum TaxID=129788 RepID=UPI00295C0674|nr:macrophage mannose receptor 1-like isoform X2 [Ruditapes philippinarum]
MTTLGLLGLCFYLAIVFTQTEQCEDGWEWWNDKCYLISEKFLVWEDARKYCDNNGAQLLKVDNEQEHEYIRTRISEMHLHYVWIGAKYSRLRQKHLWIDGSEMNFNGWAPGEPDGSRGCVDYLHKYNYQWNSHCDCINTRGRFICEKGCGEGWQLKDHKCVHTPEPSSSLVELKADCEDHGAVLTRTENEKEEVAYICEKECDIGWEKFENKCYKFADQSRDWEDAESYCRDLHGSLVIVENEQEHEYIQRKIAAANYVYVWIGAKYDHKHGEYRWVDGSPLNFTKWAPGLPGTIKGCVDYLHKYHYMWNSHTGCTETKGPFICQKVPKTHLSLIEETIKDSDLQNALIEDEMFPKIQQITKPPSFTVNYDEVFKGSNFCDETTTTTTTTTDSYTPETESPGGGPPTIGGPVPTIDGITTGTVFIPTIDIEFTMPTTVGDDSFCFPNNTIEVYNLPKDSYYLAIQNTTGTYTTCTVSNLDATSVKITGCNKDDPIILTHGTYPGIESYKLHTGTSLKITCVEIPEEGVVHSINSSLIAVLQIDSDESVESSYTLTSSLNSTYSEVGDPVAWNILFPAEYTLKVTACTGKPDTSDSGVSSVNLISNDGCTINTELISSFEDGSPGKVVALLSAFKFYGYDSIILRCDVKVCPSSGTAACTTTCNKRKRSIRHAVRRRADDSFTATVMNRLTVSDGIVSAEGSSIGVPSTMFLLLNFIFGHVSYTFMLIV